MTGAGRFAHDSAVALAGRLAAITLSLALAVGLFRLLGPAQYGGWTLLIVVVTSVSVLDFGLAGAVEREVAHARGRDDPREAGAVLSTALALVAAAVAIPQAAVLLWQPDGAGLAVDVWQGARVLPAAFGVALASLVLGGALTGLRRFLASHAWRVAGLTVGTGGVLALALAGVTRLDVLVGAYAAGLLVTCAGCAAALRTAWPAMPLAGGIGRRSSVRLIRLGGALQTATLGPLAADYAFRLIVASRFGADGLGLYDLGGRVAVTLRSLTAAMQSALVPHAVGLFVASAHTELRRLHRLAMLATAAAILPGSVLLIVIAPHLAAFLLPAGENPAVLTSVIRLLVVAHAATALVFPGLFMARAAGHAWPEAAGATIGALLGVGAALVLPSLPTAALGLWGAHAALLIGVRWWLPAHGHAWMFGAVPRGVRGRAADADDGPPAPLRVLCFVAATEPSPGARYRVLQYLPALARLGIACDVVAAIGPATARRSVHGAGAPPWRRVRHWLRVLLETQWACARVVVRAEGYDRLLVYRVALPWWAAVLLRHRRQDLVYDVDDALDAAEGTTAVERVRGWHLRRALRRAARLCAVVTTSNARNAGVIRSLGGTAIVIPTSVAVDRYAAAPRAGRASGALVLGWIGTPSTATYLAAIEEALEAVQRARPGTIVRLVGSGRNPFARVPCELIEWSAATEHDEVARFDIGLMPMPDTPWTRGKAALKALQYGAAGLPTVASWTPTNEAILEPGGGARLCRTNAEWTAALVALVDDPGTRALMGRAARREVESAYSIEANAPRLAAVLRRNSDDATQTLGAGFSRP